MCRFGLQLIRGFEGQIQQCQIGPQYCPQKKVRHVTRETRRTGAEEFVPLTFNVRRLATSHPQPWLKIAN
jgi:hypothetical protein